MGRCLSARKVYSLETGHALGISQQAGFRMKQSGSRRAKTVEGKRARRERPSSVAAQAQPQPRTMGGDEQPFRMLVQGVKEYAIFMLDQEGNVVSWTAGAERIKGYRAAEIIGLPHSTFYTPEELAVGAPRKHLDLAARQGRHLVEGWRVRKDGTRFWAEVLTSALRDPTLSAIIRPAACAGPRSYTPSPAAFNLSDQQAASARRAAC